MKLSLSTLCNLAFAGLLLGSLGGCSTETKPDEDMSGQDAQAQASSMQDDDRVQTYPGQEGEGISLLPGIEDALTIRVVYFEYDSSQVAEAQREVVEAHGKFLASNPDTRVVLEGHADERGSREYNLALGERRAIAVKNQLVLLGALDSQIKVVSYGEERPAVEGQDEDAWQQNRRVEIFY